MKRQFLKGLGGLVVTPILAIQALNAAAGVREGGGGAQIEAAFRLAGYKLIYEIRDNSKANAVCSADLLTQTLDTTKIEVVKNLIDPTTLKPIEKPLDAWTTPHYIQLLQSSWQNLVGVHSQAFHANDSVEVLILHELYRATGKCDDDDFRLSEKVYPLITGQGQEQFSESFAFTHEIPRAYMYGDLFCDEQEKNCTDFTYLIKNVKIVPDEDDPRLFKIDDEHVGDRNHESIPAGTFSKDLPNQVDLISAQHPLILIHNISSGTWSEFIK